MGRRGARYRVTRHALDSGRQGGSGMELAERAMTTTPTEVESALGVAERSAASNRPTNDRFDTLEEQLLFEQFVADFAVRFQNLPADRVDGEIVASLEALTRVLGVERSGLALFGADHRSLRSTHDWEIGSASCRERVCVWV